MVKAAVSEFKARLPSYLRLIKSGERVEIQDRGIPVAILSGLVPDEELQIIPPSRDPSTFNAMRRFRPQKDIDVVDFLLEDRRRR